MENLSEWILLLIGNIWLLIVYIAICLHEDPKKSMFIYRVVLAIGAAAVASIIPGIINIDYNDEGSFMWSAGGTFVILIIVLLTNPGQFPIDVTIKKEYK